MMELLRHVALKYKKEAEQKRDMEDMLAEVLNPTQICSQPCPNLF